MYRLLPTPPLDQMLTRAQFDCGHFRKANDFLQERYGIDGIIDWSLTEKVPSASTAKVVQTAPKSVAETSDSSGNSDSKKNRKEKDKERKHDDTDYDSEGLDEV